MLRLIVGAVHLLSLAAGVASNLVRIQALQQPLDEQRRKVLFTADNVAGLVAITWIGSGLWRAFGGLEKGTEYYLHNPFFHVKMTVLCLGFFLEVWPMVTFIKWRYAEKRGEAIDDSKVPLIRKLLWAECASTAILIVCATAMAQGLGAPKAAEPEKPPTTAAEVFRARCFVCHGAKVRTGGFDMETDPRAMVGGKSTQWPELVLVKPGDPDGSLLVRKLRGTHEGKGQRMPLTGPLAPAEMALVEEWVKSGALP